MLSRGQLGDVCPDLYGQATRGQVADHFKEEAIVGPCPGGRVINVLQPLSECFAVAPINNANPFCMLLEAPPYFLGSLQVEALLLDRVGGCHGGAVGWGGRDTVGRVGL